MEQKPRASDFAKLGLDLWEQGKLVEAEENSRQALSMLSADHWALPDVRGQLAGILSAQGRIEEATLEFERTLAEELQQVGGDEKQPSLRAIRYFLAEHHLRGGNPARALAVIHPALGLPNDFLLRLIESDAYAALGRVDQARETLRRALESASTDHAREEVKRKLAAFDADRNSSPKAG